MAMLTLRISDELNQRIERLAIRSNRTKTFFVTKMIEQAIEDMEDQILAELAVAEYRTAKPEDRKLISWDEMEARINAKSLDDQSSPVTRKGTEQIARKGKGSGQAKAKPASRPRKSDNNSKGSKG